MNREDMEKVICSILLLLSLTSCVSGAFTRTSYEAEENHNITMEWIFSNLINRPLDSYIVYCEMPTDDRRSVLFHLHKGVEDPEYQDEQFTGRVQCDKDVLREGRLRLHMSRLRADDSGVYVCQVIIDPYVSFRECRLNVTAAKNWPGPKGHDATSRGWIGLYSGLGLTAAVVLAVCCLLFIQFRRKCGALHLQRNSNGSVETVESEA
ncbi:uncharacterized protein LOC119481879 isoform X5 [Sebastes umbrosus]|uniref:uncharacterized protein LOC119481879 isoform X5 n=1 Tax=Sebastes umbrosus TaxID=72105 RepID=UPI00189CD793|nr:uncharacterized protein LOC119481879 isoform X5 [Sebastes umbrosus]